MRKINKDFGNPPAKLLEPGTQKLIEDSLRDKGGHEFKTGVYGHPDVRAVLNVLYNNKCAFCETDTTAGATMQVEHYRPKAKVTDGGQELTGYYWLGYQWSNLLLACSACNNKKRNNFPLQVGSTRLSAPPLLGPALDTTRCLATGPDLTGEQPLFVNPETDPDPRSHFSFTATGEAKGRTPEGRATIDAKKGMNLNREPLVAARQKVFNSCRDGILRELNKWEEGKISEASAEHGIELRIIDLISVDADNAPYAEFARTCWQEFQAFVITPLNTPTRQAKVQAVYDTVLDEARRAGLVI